MTDEQLDEIEKMVDHPDLDDLCDLATHALPLVKALREARARCETLRELADEKAHEAGLYARRMMEAQKAARDARALLAALKEEHRPADEIRAQLLAEIEAHAETKAEVERLRDEVALLKRHLSGAWQDRDRAEAALKEGGP